MTSELQHLNELRGRVALFYDTETTGIPTKYPQLEFQPHVIQLAWVVARIPVEPFQDLIEVASFCQILRLPDDVKVAGGAEKVHGISAEKSRRVGIEKDLALALLSGVAGAVDVRVAHNGQFDDKLLGFEYERAYGEPVGSSSEWRDFEGLPSFCTMQLSAPVLKLPPTRRMLQAGRNHPKSPKLEEAYKYFTDHDLEGAHDALADVRGTMAVLHGLLDLAAAEAEE